MTTGLHEGNILPLKKGSSDELPEQDPRCHKGDQGGVYADFPWLLPEHSFEGGNYRRKELPAYLEEAHC